MEKMGKRIRSIWIADVAHQGESAVINEHSLGNDRKWNLNFFGGIDIDWHSELV